MGRFPIASRLRSDRLTDSTGDRYGGRSFTLPGMALTYRDAGVDLDSYEEAMKRLPDLVARTHTPRMMPLPGGFAGLFKLFDGSVRYEDPVLVSGPMASARRSRSRKPPTGSARSASTSSQCA